MTTQTVRRRVFVEGFQRRFVIIQIVWVVVGMLVLAAILLVPLMSSVRGQSETGNEVLLFHGIVWSTFVAVTALLSMLFIRMSHKVAGSIRRFRDAFGEIAGGRLDIQVGTRDGDYLTAERDDLNAMIKSLRTKIQDSQSAVGELSRALGEKRAQGGALSAADLEALQKQAARAGEALSGFTVA